MAGQSDAPRDATAQWPTRRRPKRATPHGQATGYGHRIACLDIWSV
jgi:hypothetical protein